MTTRRALFFLLTAGIMLAQDAPPPTPAKTTGSVDGKVVNTANGEPVRKVSVLLQPRNGAKGVSYGVVSGGNGRFVIEDVEPGEYTISADHQGFMVKVPGASGAPFPPVKVEKGQVVELTIPLIPLGVITGRVMDEDGDPVRGAQVNVQQYGYVAGKLQLRDMDEITANDKGEFRVWGLRPGMFYLRAAVGRGFQVNFNVPGEQVRGQPLRKAAPTYYPSTTDAARAVPIDVAAGALLRGMDIRLRREALFTVRGKLPVEDNRQMTGGFNLQIVSRDGIPSNSGARWTSEFFDFAGILPGSYLIKGMRMNGGKRTYASQALEVVNEDVDVGVLTFLPGVDVSGVVRTEGAAKLPANARVFLQQDGPRMFAQPNVEVKPDGTFLMHDVAPDIYQVNVNVGAGTGIYLKSIQVGDHEAGDRRVDVTGGGQLTLVLAGDVGEVEGSVQNGNGEPAAHARVTLVPLGVHEGRQDLSRFAFSTDQGEFKIRNVPPGEYKMFAWEDVPAGAPQNPEFRKPFEKKGVAVKVEPSGHAKADVTVISVAEMQRSGAAAR
jgi:hypothetical protein